MVFIGAASFSLSIRIISSISSILIMQLSFLPKKRLPCSINQITFLFRQFFWFARTMLKSAFRTRLLLFLMRKNRKLSSIVFNKVSINSKNVSDFSLKSRYKRILKMVCYSRVCYSINFQFPPHGLDVNKKKSSFCLFWYFCCQMYQF